MYKSGLPSQLDKIFEEMQELGERHGGNTTKTKNILGLGLMLKGDFDRAMKVFEEAVNDLQLDSEKGVEMLSKGENNDLSCLLVNYIKCNTMLNG
jgi:flagellar hook-basal body complex protein FliE